MGVDSKYFVRTEVCVEMIMDALKALGKENVSWQPAQTAPNHINIFFDSNDNNWGKRKINVFLGVKDSYFGMPCNMLDLSSNEEAHDVFTALAKMFGGIVQKDDRTRDCEIYQVPGAGDFRWLLERYYSRNPEVSRHCKIQIKDFIKWYERDEL